MLARYSLVLMACNYNYLISILSISSILLPFIYHTDKCWTSYLHIKCNVLSIYQALELKVNGL